MKCKLGGSCKHIAKLVKLGRKSKMVAVAKSPEILMGIGIAGVVVSTVMACRATLRIEEVLDETHNRLETIHTATETLPLEEYSDEDRMKDLVITYTQATVAVVKLYTPSVIVGGLAITSLLGSHRVLQRRNLAVMAAYKAVQESFIEYRRRVVDDLGTDKDIEYKYGVQEVKVKETIIDENGKKKKITVKKKVVDPNNLSEYARFFDEGSTKWTKTPEYNLVLVKNQMHWLNDLLHSRGHVFLNEAYDALGIQRTQAGQHVGWILSDDGDNFIDFGIYDMHRESIRDFVNGYEPVVLLDFNVDGCIHTLI